MSRIRSIASFWNRPKNAAYLFIAPFFIILLIFTIIPTISAFFIAMTDTSLFLNDAKWVGLDNIRKIFQDKRFVNSLIVSFKFTAFAVPTRLVISMLIAVFIARNTRFNKLMRSVYFLPMVCSSAVIGIMWKLTLNAYIGIIPHWLMLLGLPRIDIFHNTTYALPAIGFMSIWGSFGMTAVIFLAAIKAVPGDLYESAELDGASRTRQFWSITMPEIMSTFWYLLVTNVIGSLQVFDLIYVVTDGGPQYSTETTVAYMYYTGFTKYKLGYSAAMAVVFFFIIITLTVIMYWMMVRQERE